MLSLLIESYYVIFKTFILTHVIYGRYFKRIFKTEDVLLDTMKVLAINGSPRNNGSTAKAISLVAEKLGNADVEVVDLGKMRISHCVACMRCKTEGKCAIDDDMTSLYAKIRESEMILLASPIYFGMETGLFKNFLDRMYAMGPAGQRKADVGKLCKGSIILTCGAPTGDMIYGGVSAHLMAALKYFGITDLSSMIIPGAKPEGIQDSQHFSEYIEALEFQLK